jgi:hypothetical protein
MRYDARLRPDYENHPAWLRAELEARAREYAYLTGAAQREAIRAGLSPRARDYLLALAVRALLAQASLQHDIEGWRT